MATTNCYFSSRRLSDPRAQQVRPISSFDPANNCELGRQGDIFAVYLFVGREAPADKIEDIKQYLADPAGCDLAISRLVWQMRTFCHVGGGSESTVRPSRPPVILVKQSEGKDSRLSQDFMQWNDCRISWWHLLSNTFQGRRWSSIYLSYTKTSGYQA
jgi:hypothetical protein